ncbi:IncF plasmid conjugative transfer protein TrbF [Escherichia coli ISC41]|nr:IncF plasmid conjugative transfer protein TrbF [Escherichia coli ISC41]
MHSIFDACIDSWKADPELNNFRYMWNILMYVIPYTLWAFCRWISYRIRQEPFK